MWDANGKIDVAVDSNELEKKNVDNVPSQDSKKSSKKGIFITIGTICALIVVGIVFAVCVENSNTGKAKFIDNQEFRQKMNSLVETINQNSNLPMPILTTYNTEIISQTNHHVDNYMSKDYYYDGYTLIFSGYPTDEDEYFLTDIELQSEKYDIFGIFINTSKNEAIQKLIEFGFAESTNKETNFKNYSNDEEALCFENLDVKVAIQLRDENVSKILISVKTYYLSNRLL